MDVSVLERGKPGDAIRQWGHITLFSPWSMNASDRMREALKDLGRLPGWAPDYLHTGLEYADKVLAPLARHPLLKGRVKTDSTVLGVSRAGALKSDFIGSPKRARLPFQVLVSLLGGAEHVLGADMVVDASGTFARPNHLGSGGLHVPGDSAAARWISRDLPDVRGAARRAFAGKRTLLVGSGHSAATVTLAFRELLDSAKGTRLYWAARTAASQPYAPAGDDPLRLRAEVQREANRMIAEPPRGMEVLPGTRIESLSRKDTGLTASLDTPKGRRRLSVDRIVSCVGFSPDNSIYRELQVHECYATFGLMKLSAALLGGGNSDCLAQSSHGLETLQSPEADFYVLGSKSYGRNNSFLLRTGFEQVSEVFAPRGAAVSV